MIKLKIKLDDDTTEEVEVEEYDPKEIAKELNTSSKQMIAIGDLVTQRYSIVRVTRVKKEEE